MIGKVSWRWSHSVGRGQPYSGKEHSSLRGEQDQRPCDGTGRRHRPCHAADRRDEKEKGLVCLHLLGAFSPVSQRSHSPTLCSWSSSTIWVFSAGELTQLVAQSEHLYDDGYQSYISCLDLSPVFCADVSNCLYQSGFNQRSKTSYSCLSLPSPNIHIDFSHTFSSLD